MGVAYQAGPVGRSPFGVNGLGSRLPSSSTHSLPTFTRDRSTWDRSTSHEPGSFGSNAGALTCVASPRPTFRPLAPAAKAMLTSMPTRWRRVHSASVIGRAQSYASSNSFSPGPRTWNRGRSLRTGWPSGTSHGGHFSGSMASLPSEPGLCSECRFPVASGSEARVGGCRAVISSRPVTAVDPRGVMTREAYTPRTRASSAGGSCPASPQCRVSSAFQEVMQSCTQARSEPVAGR